VRRGASPVRWAGFVAVLALTGAMIAQVLLREATRAAPEPDVVTIRFSHTLLHAGLRDALDRVARDYERLQADRGRRVRIEQIAIPAPSYKPWLRTQLVGGTAPEIILNQYDIDDVLTARYLVPLSDLVNRPNPHNAGSPLEGQRWRDTFFDGLRIAGFNFPLAEHYGIPISASTNRMFANRRLLEALLARPENAALRARLGPDLGPDTFADFLALCEAVRPFAENLGHPLVPIAASDANALPIVERLFASQTQRLNETWSALSDFGAGSETTRIDMMAGTKSVRDPAFVSGFRLIRDVARFFQPGFLQLRRDDASFAFSQERALMIAANSWDAPSFRELIAGRFDLVVFPIPTPEPSTPGYGSFVLGPISEADTVPQGTFSLTNIHPAERTALALDFLHYLSSHAGNQTFVDASGWLPSVISVRPAPATAAFMPVVKGFPGGPLHHFNDADLRRVFQTHAFRLFGPAGSVERFLETYEPAYRRELRPGLERAVRNSFANLRQQDSVMAAHWWLGERTPEAHPQAADKLSTLVDSSHGNEVSQAYYLRLLSETPR
jgi:ABC-type glycerol-3-phosphate transport system substrate-binding protein